MSGTAAAWLLAATVSFTAAYTTSSRTTRADGDSAFPAPLGLSSGVTVAPIRVVADTDSVRTRARPAPKEKEREPQRPERERRPKEEPGQSPGVRGQPANPDPPPKSVGEPQLRRRRQP